MSLGYQRRQEMLAKLNALIPRGLRGSTQNQFRNAVCFFASQPRYTFEESLEPALRSVRQREPAFVPRMLPAA